MKNLMKRTPIQNIDVIDDAMAEILRQKTPAERLAIANGMWKFARDLIRDVLRHEHPDWTGQQIDNEVAKRLSHGEVYPSKFSAKETETCD